MNRTQVLRALGAFGAAIAGALPIRVAAEAPHTMTIHILRSGAGKTGPDNLKHAAFVPADFKLAAGVPVTITVINEDPELHSMTNSALPLDEEFSPAKLSKDGKTTIPSVTKFTITPRAGVYRWYCKEPCDLHANMWSMTTGDTGRDEEGYMAGHITVV
jgi:plastocyanin